jgi:ubiquinone/menaquinone biosynthesis C-methylase UbiE
MRVFWKRNYAHGKFGEGWSKVYVSQKVEYLKTFPFKEILKVSDYTLNVGSGMGVGEIPSYALENFIQGSVVNLDLVKNKLLVLKKYYPYSFFICADAQNLPFRSQLFKLVFASEVLEHLPKPETALDEWKRVLSNEGYLIITTPNNITPKKINIKPKGNKVLIAKPGLTIATQLGHINEYDYRVLIRSLRSRGFKIIKVVGFNFVLPQPFYYPFVFLRRMLDLLGNSISISFNLIMYKLARKLPLLLSDSILLIAKRKRE